VPTRRSIARNPRSGPPRPPAVPAGLSAAAGVQCDLEHEQTVEEAAYRGVDLAGIEAERVEFGQCAFDRVQLAGAHLGKVRFRDCVIRTSDLSNLRAEDGVLERVTLDDSRMTGLALHGGLVTDVAFSGCKVDLTNWRMTRFEAVTFQDCVLTGADFTDADLRGAGFLRCDLTGAQFSNATMSGTRFRACELAGIGGITSWAGAVVHPDDLLALSYALAGALGITVRETDPDGA
jgi:hypothetical protein